MILRRLYPGRATALPKKLKKPVAEALAEAAASEDLKQMAELLDAGAGLAHQRGHRWHCGRWWRFRVVLLDHAGALYDSITLRRAPSHHRRSEFPPRAWHIAGDVQRGATTWASLVRIGAVFDQEIHKVR